MDARLALALIPVKSADELRALVLGFKSGLSESGGRGHLDKSHVKAEL